MDVLSSVPSATYAYYQSEIKPKSTPSSVAGKTVWRCSVCGYVYEGEELPADFIIGSKYTDCKKLGRMLLENLKHPPFHLFIR